MTYDNYRWFWIGGTGQQVFVALAAQNVSGAFVALLVGLAGLGVLALIHRYRISIKRVH